MIETSLILQTNFIPLWGVSKMHFHLLYASALLLVLSNHFVTEQQQAVRRNGEFRWPWKKDCFLDDFPKSFWEYFNSNTDKQSSKQLIWHPFRKTRTTSRGLARNWNLKMNSHPPTNEISVGGLGESGPDVAVEIWQIGIFSNLSAHRATSVHLLKLWDIFCKRGLVFQITSTFLFNKHPQQTAWTTYIWHNKFRQETLLPPHW